VVDYASQAPLSDCRLTLLGNRLVHHRLAMLELSTTSTTGAGSFTFTGIPVGEYKAEFSCLRSGTSGRLVFFYPHATSIDAAAPIKIDTDTSNDLRIEALWPAERGAIVGHIGGVGSGTAVQLAVYPLGSMVPSSLGGYPCSLTRAETFRCDDLPFGRYTLSASGITDDGPIYANMLIAIDRLKTIAPSLSLNVRTLHITISPDSPSSLAGSLKDLPLKVTLEPENSPWLSSVATCQNLQCHVAVTEGRYFVDVTEPNSNSYVSSLSSGGKQLRPDQAVQLDGDSQNPSLNVYIGTDGGTVLGSLSAYTPNISAPRFVALLSDASAGSDLHLRILLTDSDGLFEFHGVPPGDYKLEQSTDINSDPLNSLLTRATPLASLSLGPRGVYDNRQ